MEELLASAEADERSLRPLRPGKGVEGTVASISGAGGGVPDALRPFVANRLRLKVVEADARPARLILPGKAAARHLRKARKARAAERLAEGDVLGGSVASGTTFGGFVDVGVADG